MEDEKKDVTDKRLLSKQACPMSASVHWDPTEDSKEDKRVWYEVYNKLPYQIRLGLVDEGTEGQILQIARKFDICKIGEVGEISRIIRDSFIVGVFEEQKIKERITSKLKLKEEDTEKLLIDLYKLRKKVSDIEGGEAEIKLEKMPIIPALKKFPEISHQLIGERKIKISGEENLREQSIKNWIDDYTLEKGAQMHSNLERSDYVFNSSNVEKLSFLEKKALSLILESYDKDADLPVDVERKIILFDTTEKEISAKLRRSVRKEEAKKKKTPVTESKKTVAKESVEEKDKNTKENQEEIEETQSKHTINLKDI